MTRKLWGGRFKKPTHPLVEQYTSSIGFDYRLARYDVEGSIAHAKMLGKCRIISAKDSAALVRALEAIRRQIASGRFKVDYSAEDIHSQIQQRVEKLAGAAAKQLHTARSRNDQVALDFRLYCLDAASQLTKAVQSVQASLVSVAGKHRAVVIAGYTHLQQAQPVLLAHHLLAYVEMLQRDCDRLADARKRMDVLPLGSAALAGTSLPIDRHYAAKLLGFSKVAANSMDAVSDRDFAMELLAVLSTIAIHLSRLAEDLILWNTEELGILVLDDAFATGSSLMPQKKNPDVLELIRGQAGFITGLQTAFLTVMKGLPLAYNRDLQWDKRLVFGAVEESLKALNVLAPLLRSAAIRKAPSQKLSDTLCATDLAEYLVKQGVAFSDAHRIVGQVVVFAESRQVRLREVKLSELQRFSPRFGREALKWIDPQTSVNRKRSFGSTNPKLVSGQLALWKKRLGVR